MEPQRDPTEGHSDEALVAAVADGPARLRLGFDLPGPPLPPAVAAAYGSSAERFFLQSSEFAAFPRDSFKVHYGRRRRCAACRCGSYRPMKSPGANQNEPDLGPYRPEAGMLARQQAKQRGTTR